ncbi:lipid kinase, YegS/Rv2252/BmrU family [Bacillus sp. OV322]|uniref:diacylglycerol/lipid kinase family protein n=1 Tax=Bacillus sp. OV322 TaxID=1882764 RepID=UPI0008F3BDEB|nr:YegS/Rv2252/BmrU family lipid kinase [Bacillus sp. OV322]SFC97094.1 lipid kinase, YegS/Rv2252/BmrU family [Bacillus sp. OV322]
MKWKKGLLIYNQNAGGGKLEKNLGECLPVLSCNIEEFLVIQTKEAGDAERLCREYGEDMDVVFVLGGDGTVHECVNGLSVLNKRPVLGILPGGTCNDFSRTLNLPQKIGKAAEEMMSGRIKEVDVGRAGERYFLNFWGIGLITDTSSNIDEHEKNLFGKIGYFLSAIRTLGDNEPFSFTMEYDGKTIEDEAIMILVLNGKYIGTNLLPFPLIDSRDGLMDIVILKKSNIAVFKELLAMKRLAAESAEPDSGVWYLQASDIKIQTAKEMEADTDGEIYLKTPANIQVMKNHLPMLCGPEA